MPIANQSANEHVAEVLRDRVKTPAAIDALAREIGVGSSTVYNWRGGRRGLGANEIVALASYLHMTTDALLGVTTDGPSVNWIDVADELAGTATAVDQIAAAMTAVFEALERIGHAVDGNGRSPGIRIRDRRASALRALALGLGELELGGGDGRKPNGVAGKMIGDGRKR
jgi:hypothetical protein